MEDEMPRRRRGAKAVAGEDERGLLMRILLHSPKDMVAGLLAAAAVSAIVANALFLQAGRHPSPMFGTTAPPAQPLPRPRPAEAAAIRSIELTPADVKAADTRAEPKYEAKGEPKPDVMSNLVVKTTAPTAPPVATPPAAAPPAAVMRPPAPVPVATPHTAAGRKIAAVQRTLTDYGYGQLKPTGLIGADTQAAIRSEEHTSELQSRPHLVCRLL